MISSKALFHTAAAAALAVSLAAPASAQRVARIVAFGDSYADDGNVFELTGTPRPAVYPNGRFSNGTNFIDTMAQQLGVPVQNFAIGGALTGSGNVSGPGVPGFQLEWQSYLAGGGPAAFPRTTGAFAPDDLLVLSIGGNDARAYRIGGGTVAGAPAAAAVSVTQATTGLNALVNAGARNITFLAGDVGRLPEAAGSPTAAAGTAFSTAFNNGIQTTLAGYANQGVIVNYLDLNRIGDRVQANLAAFGLQSAGACPIACVTTNPELLDRYLFYVDNVHLTSAGFAIVGRYAVRQLEAPLQLEAQADVGLQNAISFGNNMLGRLALSGGRTGDAARGFNVYVAGHSASVTRDPTASRFGHELDTDGIMGGVEFGFDGGVIGVGGGWTRGEAVMAETSGRVSAKGWQLGIYGGWSGGGAFVEGYAGYGWLDYDIDRDGVIDEIDGRTDGTALSAGARAGYLFGLGGVRVGPVIGLRYAEADLDAFTETGDAVLTLNIDEQETDSLVGSAGVELRGDFEFAEAAVRPYVALTAEREFNGDPRTIRYALTAAPTIVNQWQVAERSDDIYGRVTGGLDLAAASWLGIQFSGTASFGQNDGDDYGGFVGLRVGF